MASAESSPLPQPKLPAVAPSFITGGGGFVVETKACARSLLSLLTGRGIPGLEVAGAVEVAAQARNRGWLLDDLVITSESDGVRRRSCVSVKSSEQFGGATAPPDFVRLAWGQLLGAATPAPPFDGARDRICLACPLADPDLRHQLGELLAEAAAQEPAALAEYITGEGVAPRRRSLYESFRCPADIAGGRPEGDTLPGRLLRRLAFWPIDFRGPGSASEDEALSVAREAVIDPERDAARLWDALCRFADELRPRSGVVSLEALLGRLRGVVSLRAHPNLRPDLERLAGHARRQIASGKRTLGTAISVDLDDLARQVEAELAPGRVLVLYGPSGSGKSHFARAASGRVLDSGGLAAWVPSGIVNDRGLGTLCRDHQLSHPLAELIERAPHARRLLIVDAAEKLVADAAADEVAQLIAAVSPRAEVLVTVTASEVQRVVARLQQLGVRAASLRLKDVPRPDFERLRPHLSAFPELLRLASKPEAAALLSRLKVADLLVTHIERLGRQDTDRIVGEATMADWFWAAAVESSADRTRWSAFLKRLAAGLADHGRNSLPDDEIGGDEATADALVRHGILCRTEGRIAFDHDLVADWTRYKVLTGKAEQAAEHLGSRRGNVAWHPAVRLLASRRIELPTSGREGWRGLLSELEPDRVPSVHGDLVLDAVAASPWRAGALSGAAEALFADGGRLLRRLLERTLAAGTVPLADMPWERALRLNAAVGPVRFVLQHLDRVMEVAPVPACRLLAEWVAWAPAHLRVTREAAAALRGLAHRYHEERAADFRARSLPSDCGTWIYRGCLAGYATDPEDARRVLLSLAERGSAPPDPDLNRHQGPIFDLPRTLPDGSLAVTPRCEWGPSADVDDEFGRCCASPLDMAEVIDAAPDLAAELIVATTVGHPRHVAGYGSDELEAMFGRGSRYSFYPPMWFQGCFLPLLRRSPADGVRAVAMLCRHLGECFALRSRLNVDDDADIEGGEGTVAIRVGNVWREWPGDSQLFLAYADRPHTPDTVASALMALEKYLYERIDAGHDVSGLIEEILAQGSVPVLGVLSAVACYKPELVLGPLSPLLTCGEIIVWDFQRAALREDKATAGISWSMKGEQAVRTVREWVQMPHRDAALLRVAQAVFVRHGDARKLLSESASYWVERYAAGKVWPSTFDLARLASFFDPANWREVTKDGVAYSEFMLPAPIAAADAADGEANEENMFWLTAPSRCVQLLDAAQPLKQSDLEMLDGILSRNAAAPAMAVSVAQDGGKTRHGRSRADAVAAACACLLLLPREGPEPTPADRSGWRDLLIGVCGDPPPRAPYDCESSMYPCGWDRSAARVLGRLWADDLESEELRIAVCQVLFANHHETVAYLAASLSTERVRLGRHLDEFWGFLLQFAAVTERVQRARNRRPRADRLLRAAGHRLDALARQFVLRQGPTELPDRRELARLAGRGRGPWGGAVVDSGVVGAACVGLLGSRGTLPPTHVLAWWPWWNSVAEWATERARAQLRLGLGNDVGDGEAAVPDVYRDDETVIHALVRVAAAVDSDQQARSIRELVFAAGAGWAGRFIDEWLSVPVGDFEPDRYLRRWRELIVAARALTAEHTDVEAEALGLAQVGPQYWDGKAASLILGVADLMAAWLSRVHHSSDLASAARLLNLDASADARATVLPHVLAAVSRVGTKGGLRRDDGAPLAQYARLLVEAGTKVGGLAPQQKRELRELVDLLAARHIQDAIDLQREGSGL